MTIQTLKEITLPNGIRLKAGAVLSVPDAIGTALVEKGDARSHEKPGPTERKGDYLGPVDLPPPMAGVFGPDDPLPPEMPYTRQPTQPWPARSFDAGLYEDRDNFVTNMVTYVSPFGWWPGWWGWWWPGMGGGGGTPPDPVKPSESASGRAPLLSLDLIKVQCHIDEDQTADDELLMAYEMAARLHTENYLRYTLDDPATVGENIKQACLMLIAHWYRNRESVTTGRTSVGVVMPFGYQELLHPERDFPVY